MKISCRQLSTKCGQAEYSMLQEIIDGENGFSNPAYKLKYNDYKDWIKQEIDISKGINMPEGYVPCTTYVLYIDDIPVGYGRVRHSSTEHLEKVIGAGNLGYGIAKSHRGKGYGNILFKELLKKCKRIGYKQIKLFPLKENVATIKIMLKNGGKIIGDFKNYKHIIEIPIK